MNEGINFIAKLDAIGEIKSKLVFKGEDTTDPSYGFYPWERPLGEHIRLGVINLDKPPGPTSHEVVAWVKRMFALSKAGHGGTLDPKVSGVLPVALENATKVISSVVHTGKEYICVMELHGQVSDDELYSVVKMFTGKIFQRPPLRSSVKRSLRIRTIHYIDVLERDNKHVLLRVGCEAGTYIRKLVYDMGLILGVGAHMRELRRTRAGPFKEDDTLTTLQELSEAKYRFEVEGRDDLLRRKILPVEYAVSHLKKVVIRDSAVDAIAHGANLAIPGIIALHENINKRDLVAIMTLKGELVALGTALMNTTQILTLDKGIAVKTKRVVMKTGLYPRAWGSLKSER